MWAKSKTLFDLMGYYKSVYFNFNWELLARAFLKQNFAIPVSEKLLTKEIFKENNFPLF